MYYFPHNFNDSNNHDNNHDINNNPIFSPSLSESNDFLLQSDELNNNNFEFNNFEQFNNDNLLSRFPFGNDELNSFDDEHLPIPHIEPPNPYIPNEAMTTAAVTQMPVYTYKAEHTKKETKNMLTKIKKASYNNYLDLINNNIKDSKDEEIRKRNIKLRKVSNSIIGVSSREDNLDLIKLEMKDILSSPLSNNHKRFDKNYNKKAIDFILI